MINFRSLIANTWVRCVAVCVVAFMPAVRIDQLDARLNHLEQTVQRLAEGGQ